MKILVTGHGGQLATELTHTKPEGHELVSLSSSQLDISNAQQVQSVVAALQPSVVINAAAYTAVDKAENDLENAYAVNHLGAKHLADACLAFDCRLLHVSTDFVFDGAGSTPYLPESKTKPINVYGASKLAGEQAVQSVLANRSVIVRTAWVYSATGNNFVKTMLRLMAEKPELGIIADQIGSPTWAKGLALWLWRITEKPEVSGLYHWTDAGVASWYDFAVAIQELALQKNMLAKAIPVKPIPTSAYPTPASRPAYSVIDKSSAESASGISTLHWRKQLDSMLDELKQAEA